MSGKAVFLMAMAGLQKAKIKVYREPKEEITCLFNPSEYRISESAGYSNQRRLGKNKNANHYTGGLDSSLSLSLYYDLTENLGGLSEEERSGITVRTETDRIASLLKMEGSLHKPPEIEFIWGDLAYRGILKSLNREFTYFGMEGNPLRAKLDLTISAVEKAADDKEAPGESPDRTKHRMVVEGTTLWKLAWEEYGDCEKWREIAAFNDLMNPLDIRPGQILRLPALKA